MAGLLKYFPDSRLLEKPDGSQVAVSSLSGKVVLLLFYAHWCPDCRNFMPALTKFYNAHREKRNFEIIFLSCDRSPADSRASRQSMPWLAFPYDAATVERVGLSLRVDDIPGLVAIDADSGDVICASVRQKVAEEDVQAVHFPWRQQ